MNFKVLREERSWNGQYKDRLESFESLRTDNQSLGVELKMVNRADKDFGSQIHN